MSQYSTQGEPVRFEGISGNFIFIDPLFFDHLSQEIEDEDLQSIGKDDFIRQIEKKIVEGSKGYYIGKYTPKDFTPGVFELNLNHITELSNDVLDKAIKKEITAFTLESGSFLIFDMINFEELIASFILDSLIQAVETEKMEDYMERLSEKLRNRGIAYVYYHPYDEFEQEGSFIIPEDSISKIKSIGVK